MTNYELYEFCKQNNEEMFDKFYEKNKIIIPKTKDEENTLTINHSRLINLITTFNTLHYDYHKTEDDSTIKQIVNDVIEILNKTPNINYSPFSQFFMVLRSSYSVFKALPKDKKFTFIFTILEKYCIERHQMYLSHGYSNSTLQVVCDNYSHKSNSTTGINKILNMLSQYNLLHIRKVNELTQNNIYFLPDKGDKKLFEEFLIINNIEMESRKIEHDKLPDVVFKHDNHFYICELKTMNESGGGQNKQVVEFANFINFSESSNHIHYLTFLDGHYAKLLFTSKVNKLAIQRTSIESALKNNPQNYFLNTQGFYEFTKEIFD